MQEAIRTNISGHVLIKDSLSGEVLMDKLNQIHPANMGTAIARGLSHSTYSEIYKIKLGNQGTYIDASQQIVFRPPNVLGVTANLYNPTYYEIVDDNVSGTGVGNSVTFTNIPLSTSTRVIVTCVISANEAVNRPTDGVDAATSVDFNGIGIGAAVPSQGKYFFDELGLFTDDGTAPDQFGNQVNELMLSHLVFSPIEHTGNRELTIIYTLTMTVT